MDLSGLASSFNFSILLRLLGKLLQLCSSFFIFTITARTLGPEWFGKLSFASALVTLLIPIAGFGSVNSLRALIGKNSSIAGLIESALFIRWVGSSLFTLLILLCAIYIKDSSLSILLLIGCLTGFLNSFDVLDVRLLSHLKGKKVALLDFIQSSCHLVLASILSLGNINSVLAFGLLPIISKTMRTIVLFQFNQDFQLGKVIKKSNIQAISILLSRGWIILLSFMAISTYSKIDKLMIGFYLEQADVGIYSVADQILYSLSSIFGVITSSYYPKLIASTKTSTYYEFYKTMLLCALLLFLSSLIFVPMGFHLVFGSLYSDSAKILAILSPSFIFLSVISASSTLLNIRGELKQIAEISFLIAFLNILLNILMIPKYGIVGAAIASVLSLLVGSVYNILSSYPYRISLNKISKEL